MLSLEVMVADEYNAAMSSLSRWLEQSAAELEDPGGTGDLGEGSSPLPRLFILLLG